MEKATHEAAHEFNTAIPSGWWGDWNMQSPDIASFTRAMKAPMWNNAELRRICWNAYEKNGVIRNAVDYMVALPTLDRVIFLKNRGSDNEKRRERNRRLFSQVLDNVRDREIVRDSLLKNACDGVSFYYFVVGEKPPIVHVGAFDAAQMVEINAATAPNCSLFPLPVSACQIVGYRNSAPVLGFDLRHFSNSSGAELMRKLKQYPEEIRQGWLRFHAGKGEQLLILDNTKTIVTKVGAKRESVWGVPLVAAALDDMLYYDYFIQTKRGKLGAINNRIIWMEFPQGKEVGTSSITGTQQREQYDRMVSALRKDVAGVPGVSHFSAAAGTTVHSLKVDTDIFDGKNESDLLERVAGNVGFGAPLINGVGRGSYASLKLNLELVSARVLEWVAQFQTELNKVINAHVIKDPASFTEAYYLPMTHVNKSDMIKHMKELYTLGRGSWQAWISAVGIDFEAYLAMLDDALERGFENKYPIHETAYTTPVGGRPPGETPEGSGNETPRAGV